MNNCSFKVGDVVRCINNNLYEDRLTVDQCYVVNEILCTGPYAYNNLIKLKGVKSNGNFPHRFVLVSRTELSEALYT